MLRSTAAVIAGHFIFSAPAVCLFSSHYSPGLCCFKKAVTTNSFPELEPALKHFQAALEINADMDEAQYATQNIALIEKVRGQRN